MWHLSCNTAELKIPPPVFALSSALNASARAPAPFLCFWTAALASWRCSVQHEFQVAAVRKEIHRRQANSCLKDPLLAWFYASIRYLVNNKTSDLNVMYWSNLSKVVIGSCKLKLYRSHWDWGSRFSTCIFLIPIIFIYFSITKCLKEGQENAIKSSLEGNFILIYQTHGCYVLHMVSDDLWFRGIHLLSYFLNKSDRSQSRY